MQRYRVNYGLLIGLAVGLVVTGGSVYGVWKIQMSRNAENLLEQASTLEQEGEIAKAGSKLREYLRFRPEDAEARQRMVKIYLKLITEEIESRELEYFWDAKKRLVNALPRLQNADESRIEFIDLLMSPIFRHQFDSDAESQLQTILAKRPDDAGFLLKQATCLASMSKPEEAAKILYRLIGYDHAANQFDVSQAIAHHEVKAFQLLSQLLIGEIKNRRLADRLQEYLIATNPDSAEAHLLNHLYLSRLNRGVGTTDDLAEASKAALEKAFELDPNKIDTLFAMGQQSLRDKETEQAQKYFTQGLEIDPTVSSLYFYLSEIEKRNKNPEAALTYLDKGIENVGDQNKAYLLIKKTELQIGLEDFEASKKTIRTLKQYANPKSSEVVFVNAQLATAQGEWLKASRLLREVRRKSPSKSQQRHADVLLGLCYEKMGKSDLALQSYKSALLADPNNLMAKAGTTRMEKKLGRISTSNQLEQFDVAGHLAEMLNRPEKEQDWEKFDAYLDSLAEAQKLSEVDLTLIKIEVLVQRKKYSKAEDLLREVYEVAGESRAVWLKAVRLKGKDPNGGPAAALLTLDRVVKKFGDDPVLRLDRANLLIAQNNENVVESLLALTENMDDWETKKQVQVWRGVAQRLGLLGKRDEAEKAWQQVAQLTPDDLPTLLNLFDMANTRNDDEAMVEAQDKILALVGSKTDSIWVLTEASRLFSQYKRGLVDETTPQEIRKLISIAIKERPDWANPYFLRARLDFHEKKYDKELEDYRLGLSRGRGNSTSVSRFVRLLAAQGKYAEALKALDPYPAENRTHLLGSLYAEILFRAGKLDDAAEAGGRIVSNQDDNAQLHLWYGQFMQKIAASSGDNTERQKECIVKAGEAFAKTIELAPANPQAWMSQITLQLATSQPVLADQTIRLAQLALDEDLQPELLARSYSMMGRWFDAENLYRLILEKNPGKSSVTRQLAAFYASSRYRGQEGQAKATVLINNVLKQYAKDNESVSQADAHWARRTAAKMLAASGDYQSLLKAEKLLASNSINGVLSNEDKLEMIQILSSRSEPLSRQKALKLLEEVQRQQDLPAAYSLILAKLYFKAGDWGKCRDQMVTLRAMYPRYSPAKSAYIRMLLEHGGRTDLKIAENQLKELIKIAPNAYGTIELVSLVYSKQGKESQARAVLKNFLPRDFSKINIQQAPFVQRVALLLVKVGDLESAEKILAALAQHPDAPKIYALQFATFVGVHSDAQRGLDSLRQLKSEVSPTQLIRAALTIYNSPKGDLPSDLESQIETWIAREEREDPGAIEVNLLKASFRDQQKQYEEASEIYRDVLAHQEFVGGNRAAILNNLAYLITLGAAEEKSPNEAAGCLQEAIDILGPIADILDTRAMIWIGRKQYQAAIDDLNNAVIDKPTASSYFHLTLAHLGLGQKEEAKQAWEKSLELGLTHESVNRLERKEFDKVEAQMGTN